MALIEVYVTKINEVIVSIGHCGFSACWGPAPSSNSPGTRNPTCREPYCCWKKWCNRYKSWIVSNILVVLAGFLVLAVGLLLRVIQWLKFPLQLGFLAGINQSFHPVKPIGSYEIQPFVFPVWKVDGYRAYPHWGEEFISLIATALDASFRRVEVHMEQKT